jgi:hypothetical protein
VARGPRRVHDREDAGAVTGIAARQRRGLHTVADTGPTSRCGVVNAGRDDHVWADADRRGRTGAGEAGTE